MQIGFLSIHTHSTQFKYLLLWLWLLADPSTGKPAVQLQLDSTLVREDDVFEGFVRVGMPLALLQVLHLICLPDKLAIGASPKCPT